MNNNNQSQGFQKGQPSQPPRSPEKLEGAMRDNKPGTKQSGTDQSGSKSDIESDDKTKRAGSGTQEFKPERKTVAGNVRKSDEDSESESACGTGCGSGKMN